MTELSGGFKAALLLLIFFGSIIGAIAQHIKNKNEKKKWELWRQELKNRSKVSSGCNLDKEQ